MIVHVALPIPVRKSFSYTVADKWTPFVKPFLRVKVPFRNKDIVGFIVGAEEGDAPNLKEIHEVIDPFPLLDEVALRLVEWASRYYIAPQGLVLRYALPPSLPIERYLKIQMMSELDRDGLRDLALRKACIKAGRDVVYGYHHNGFLGLHDTFTNGEFLPYIRDGLGSTAERTLFMGSAGERLKYYIDITAHHLDKGENVLMLVPDHRSIGQFFFDRLSKHFPGRILRYGVSVTAKKRMEAYFRARREGGFLILGSRSCLFLPVFRNGHIIVERPEEDEYRNEEGFRFNAVRVAMERSEIERIPIVLGTVSPPLEIFKRADDGELHIIEKAHHEPIILREIIREKGISASGGLPEELIEIISRAVENNERIAIYTPRKDYSSRLNCLDCKNLFRCPVCGAGLSYQKQKDLLVCAGCGKKYPYEDRCLQCGSRLIQFSNVGVEYLEQKLKNILPGVSVIGLMGDAFGESQRELKGLCPGKPAVIIGTHALSRQYGLKADKLIMVEWEELMRIGGYRAGEKMLHTLSNLIDALEPDEIYALMTRKKRVSLKEYLDVKAFCKNELQKRKDAHFPPYGRIFLLEVEKKNETAGMRLLEKVKGTADKFGIAQHITGPLLRKTKKYRWRMILKGDEDQLYEPLSAIGDLPGVLVEADPVNI